jgi:hypothetical protein
MRIWLLICLGALSGALPAEAQQNGSSPHGPLQKALDCGSCHTASGWKPMRRDAKFDHARQAKFALSGMHAQLGCKSCHTDNRFDRPRAGARDCATCHVDVHQGRLSRDCASCHDTKSFARRAGSDAHARTNFPLTGVHAQAPCAGCHRTETAGRFTTLPTTCISCHQTNYQNARSPVHDPASFPATCNQCHTSSSWRGARFDHQARAPNFPLAGVHASISCSRCHVQPGNALIYAAVTGPNDCVTCHRADYDRAHTASSFPTTCTMCHQQTAWSGARIDHDRWFPIYSGAHRGRWSSCTQCHTSPPNFAVFTCLTCHLKPKTDEQHSGRTGYSYDSVRCLACHPRGSHDD